MTEKEIHDLSTQQERDALLRYKALQRRCRENDTMNEGDLLLWSECVGILAARNKRLGLIE